MGQINAVQMGKGKHAQEARQRDRSSSNGARGFGGGRRLARARMRCQRFGAVDTSVGARTTGPQRCRAALWPAPGESFRVQIGELCN